MPESRAVISAARRRLEKAGPRELSLAPPVRAFYLLRLNDIHGQSGEGVVAQGIIFPNGWCVLCWLTDTASVTYYPSIDAVKAIHGHDGATQVIVQSLAVVSESEV